MNPIQQGFPNANVPFIAANGCMATPWRYFLDAVWQRTGGASGTNGYFAYVNGDSTQPFQVATAVASTDAPPLAQVQSLDATVLATAESFATNAANAAQSAAEAFATSAANSAQTAAETFATSAANAAQSNAETYAAAQAATAQSNAEAFATSAANTAQSNAEAYTDTQLHTAPGAAFVPIVVTASPFAYTASATGHVALTGNTSSLTLTRGTATINLKSNTAFIPMQSGDVLTATYSAAPTLTWIPR